MYVAGRFYLENPNMLIFIQSPWRASSVTVVTSARMQSWPHLGGFMDIESKIRNICLSASLLDDLCPQCSQPLIACLCGLSEDDFEDDVA